MTVTTRHGARRADAAALALFTALSLAAVPALAQESGASAVTDRQVPLPPALPEPASPEITPLQPFAEEGITLALNYTGEAAANLSGGLKKDAAYAGQVYVGADLDMEALAGIAGATVHAAVTNRHGKSLSAVALGNNTSVQEIWGTQNTHLAILTWEQKLFDGALTLEAGKSQANIHFLNSQYYCHFQNNSVCGNPTFVFKSSNFTYFPASSWMAHAKAQLTREISFHTGVYEVNPRRKRPDDDGFAFSFKGGTGVVIPWELEYAPSGGLPGRYILGGWIDRGDYADPLRDANGDIAILSGEAPATRKGRSGLYVRAEQQITGNGGSQPHGLAIFGVVMTNLSGRVEESRFLDFGLVHTGTFAGRDKDTLGFVISDQRFSDLAMERMRAARIAAGGNGKIARHQTMMELAYGAQLSPAIRVSPNVQYILNPDQTGAPFRTRDIDDALIVGFKFTIDAPTLLGR
ncbi:carbohydrate porin [Novosphingobium aquimarinum]|uniref:carbohydrate porin n=1 Tax=Novosphingobium aquimarinum TaxID=2682494 RepID=UPI0012ECADF6|nr:carbohydrate porin [Novosphingobium aquimarinum]